MVLCKCKSPRHQKSTYLLKASHKHDYLQLKAAIDGVRTHELFSQALNLLLRPMHLSQISSNVRVHDCTSTSSNAFACGLQLATRTCLLASRGGRPRRLGGAGDASGCPTSAAAAAAAAVGTGNDCCKDTVVPLLPPPLPRLRLSRLLSVTLLRPLAARHLQ